VFLHFSLRISISEEERELPGRKDALVRVDLGKEYGCAGHSVYWTLV